MKVIPLFLLWRLKTGGLCSFGLLLSFAFGFLWWTLSFDPLNVNSFFWCNGKTNDCYSSLNKIDFDDKNSN